MTTTTTDPELAELLHEAELLQKELEDDKLSTFTPTTKQRQFINSTATYTLLSGGNQLGKSVAAQLLIVYAGTGLAPGWYRGPRLKSGAVILIGGLTDERLRDCVTRDLFGPKHDLGSGMLPKSCLDPRRFTWKHGSSEFMDSAYIRHHDDNGNPDGWVQLKFVTYKAADPAGYSADMVVLDEDPNDTHLWGEFKGRITGTDGRVYIVCTPMKGANEIYREFNEDTSREFRMIRYTIDDAEWMAPALRAKKKREWKGKLEERLRLYGEPIAGDGAIFPYNLHHKLVDPYDISSTQEQIIGLDFPHTVGTFAASRWAINPLNRKWTLLTCYKARGKPPSAHAENVRAMMGALIPCAWPHDANRIIDGRSMKRTYEDFGLNMLPVHAHVKVREGERIVKVNAVNVAIEKARELIESDRLEIFDTPENREFLLECQQYRQEDGKPLKKQEDHLIDSWFKALMMDRWAMSLHEVTYGSSGSGGESYEGEYEFFS